jgi:hypothetical protein
MNDFFRWLAQMAVQEGGVVITPHINHFRARMEGHFLDELRQIPAAIVAPPGVDPYGMARRRGNWMMVWLPEKD